MSPDPPSIAVLAARAQLGDRASMETLLRILCPLLRSHVRFLLRDDDDADDVLQDSLWLIARRLGSLQDVALVRAWSYRIATREAYRSLRRSRRLPAETLDDEALGTPYSAPEEDPALAPDHRLLAQLALLPQKAQAVVRLRYFDKLSQQEIAAALEIPIGTVKSRLAYGLNRLREIIGQESTQATLTDNSAEEGQRP